MNTSVERFELFSSEGRGAAAEVDAFLSQGNTRLPNAGGIVTRVGLQLPKCKYRLIIRPYSDLLRHKLSPRPRHTPMEV